MPAVTWATGREYSARRSPSASTHEVRALIEQAHNEAYQVINDNRDVLDRLALALLEKETLDHNSSSPRSSRTSRSLPPRPQWLSSENRPVSYQPPVEVPKSDVHPEWRRGEVSRSSRARRDEGREASSQPGRRDPRPRRLGLWLWTVSASNALVQGAAGGDR